jgi:hypothetical protein
MVFDELRNDYELEELDEFHLFDNPKSELVPIVRYLLLIIRYIWKEPFPII